LDSAFINKYLRSENQAILLDKENELMNPEKPEYYFDGKTCFLIGPETFSSANFLADAVKTYKLIKLIGMPTGEATNDFGEIVKFNLPHSNVLLIVSSTFDVGADADIKRHSAVQPDILINNNIMEKAVEWLRGKNY
jgi:hypothetical protein